MKQQLPYPPGPIGVFDSGYGGLTILNKIREILPEYDYIYLIMPVRPTEHVLLKSYTNSLYKQSTSYLNWAAILLY